jgi:ATPase subunit of ABC transporter with duplicated ATPase domains
LRIGYLPQGYTFEQETLSIQLSLSNDLGSELERLSAAISESPEDMDLLKDYDAILQQVERRPSVHPRAVLESLGLGGIPDDQSIAKLSGGQKTRLALA